MPSVPPLPPTWSSRTTRSSPPPSRISRAALNAGKIGGNALKQLDDLLTPKQLEARRLLFGTARHVMLYGGSRSGKTFAACYAVIKRAIAAPGSRHCIARFRFNHAKRTIVFDTMPKVLKLLFPGLAIKLDRTDWLWRLPNGSEIWVAGLDDKERTEKILGMEFATVYLNECSQIGHQAVRLMRTRLAQRVELDKTLHPKGGYLPLRMYYDQNPPSQAHWSYWEFVLGKNPIDKGKVAEGSRAALLMNPRDNPFLSEEYFEELESLPLKDRLRFLEGKFQADEDLLLWTYDSILRCEETEDLEEVVVSVDPSGTQAGDEVGIVAAGRSAQRYFVLDDQSRRATPNQWARAAILLHDRSDILADGIIAERNFGGDMVENTIEQVAKDMWRKGERTTDHIKVIGVVSSRGKVLRAEPVAALYSRHLVYHAGQFDDLEDEMTQFSTAWDRKTNGSPNRVDALVFGITHLMHKQPDERPMVFGAMRMGPQSRH